MRSEYFLCGVLWKSDQKCVFKPGVCDFRYTSLLSDAFRMFLQSRSAPFQKNIIEHYNLQRVCIAMNRSLFYD